MKTKFTPGPWKISIPESSNGFVYIDQNSSKFPSGSICTAYANNAFNDAKLISCAPEMYDLLESLSEMMPMLDEQTHPHIEMDAVKYDIDKLLAKARGEQ